MDLIIQCVFCNKSGISPTAKCCPQCGHVFSPGLIPCNWCGGAGYVDGVPSMTNSGDFISTYVKCPECSGMKLRVNLSTGYRYINSNSNDFRNLF